VKGTNSSLPAFSRVSVPRTAVLAVRGFSLALRPKPTSGTPFATIYGHCGGKAAVRKSGGPRYDSSFCVGNVFCALEPTTHPGPSICACLPGTVILNAFQ
jgi:hypothetical protein